MPRHRNLILAHLWLAFAVFAAAAVLGVWQMWARSPLPAPFLTASTYFSSATAHGTATAYVLTTFMVMGFGYYVAETALARPLPAPRWAWIAFALGVVGTLMAVVTILTGRAAVLFTFYPPLIASVFYYLGLVLVVAASWIWCVLMLIAMGQWKRANPGRPVPLAMFATVANAVMWLWTTVGVAAVTFTRRARGRRSARALPSRRLDRSAPECGRGASPGCDRSSRGAPAARRKS